ncbi:MAG: carbohydrate kinase family protein, partial [Bacteroidales bacterium]|nr:carbohydrate kinase family protein [Bacteroidales bacterium]NLZ19908.1 carbohydrate kinase family protein [Bacteroidales bacterium]
GDSFTAAFVVAYLRGDSLSDAQRLANETAAYVCSCKGAMPL